MTIERDLLAARSSVACDSVHNLVKTSATPTLVCQGIETSCSSGDASGLGHATGSCNGLELYLGGFLDGPYLTPSLTMNVAFPFKAAFAQAVAAYQPSYDRMWTTAPVPIAEEDVTKTATFEAETSPR